MRIKYIGIVTDPYEPGCYDGAVKYEPVSVEADLVLVSHDHADHNWSSGVGGNPDVISEAGDRTVREVMLRGVPTFHDTTQGSERGDNIIFRFVVDGLSLCHLGDLGHTLEADVADQLKPVDILFLPVGGVFAIGSDESDSIISALSPKLVIPMHFKTEGVDFPIAPVDDFLAGRDAVSRPGGSEAVLTAEDLPSGTLVLDPAALP
jgi:L-ascorbate metabolism protein UlaG (beta-lactamase superfamily)